MPARQHPVRCACASKCNVHGGGQQRPTTCAACVLPHAVPRLRGLNPHWTNASALLGLSLCKGSTDQGCPVPLAPLLQGMPTWAAWGGSTLAPRSRTWGEVWCFIGEILIPVCAVSPAPRSRTWGEAPALFACNDPPKASWRASILPLAASGPNAWDSQQLLGCCIQHI